MVGNQIPNLILVSSFDHNSCISNLNEQWEGILGIYIFRTFQWYPKVPIWYLFTSNQGYVHLGLSHECNFESGSALGSHWFPSFALSPIYENLFHTQTQFLGLMGPCTPHLVTSPMLRLWHSPSLKKRSMFLLTLRIFMLSFHNNFVTKLGFILNT